MLKNYEDQELKQVEKKISFFLPFRDEGKNLNSTVLLIRSVAQTQLSDFEIILINDASSDNSTEDARKLATDGIVRLIELKGHLGFGAAFLEGLRAARFDFAMYLSADGDVSQPELTLILKAWSGDVPLIQYSNTKSNRTWFRSRLSALYTFLVAILSGTNLPYYNGYNILPNHRKKIASLKEYGFSTQAYAVLELVKGCSNFQVLGTDPDVCYDKTSKALTLRNFKKSAFFIGLLFFKKLKTQHHS